MAAALPAAARAGVFVTAPAKAPAIIAALSPRRRPTPTAARVATPRMPRRSASGPPAVRMTWKKFGPDWMPMAKVKIASPRVPSSLGTSIGVEADAPHAASAMPLNRTAAAPRLTPLILMCPSSIPAPTRRNRTRTALPARWWRTLACATFQISSAVLQTRRAAAGMRMLPRLARQSSIPEPTMSRTMTTGLSNR